MVSQLQQLLIVKRLFVEAMAYADRGDSVSAGIAISMLQDSAELYIWTLIKERDIAVKEQAGFVACLDTLQKEGITIPNAAKLQELNKARVGFKHYGNLPAPTEARKHHTYVEDFLRQAIQNHFGVNFDDLSLVELVADQEIRNRLRVAEANIAAGDLRGAVTKLDEAKDLTFGRMQKYIPQVGYNLRYADQSFKRIEGFENTNYFAYITDYLTALREASLVAMLKLPVDDYAFLRNFLPSAASTRDPKRSKYIETECRRAVECIVRLCQRLEAQS